VNLEGDPTREFKGVAYRLRPFCLHASRSLSVERRVAAYVKLLESDPARSENEQHIIGFNEHFQTD
jgi:hypothetical protein